MKFRKIMASLLAVAVIGVSIPTVSVVVSDNSITASAEYVPPYTEINEGNLRFEIYSDHAVAAGFRYDLEYDDRDSITEVIIPDTVNGLPVTEIGYRAFDYYENINSVIIPETIERIGLRALVGTEWWSNWLASQPDGPMIINNILVGYNGKVGSDTIIIPNNVTSIAAGAFMNYNYEPTTDKDGNVIWVEDMSVTSIYIPESVSYIGEYAFSGFTSLKEITIPETVKEIGGGVFNYCPSLESVVINANVKRLDWGYFDGTYRGFFEDCSSLKNVVLPESLEFIVDRCFNDCGSLESITLPASLKSISSGYEDFVIGSFYSCTNLKEVTVLSKDCDFRNSVDSLYEASSLKRIINNGYPKDENGSRTGDDYYNGVIRGYKNSTAQAYAEKCGYAFESLDEAPITTTTTPTTTTTTSTTSTTTSTTTTSTSTTTTTSTAKPTTTTTTTTTTSTTSTITSTTSTTTSTTSTTTTTTSTITSTTSTTTSTTTTTTKPTTTSTTTTTSTASTTSETTTSTTTAEPVTTTTVSHIASDDDLCSWAVNDYQSKTGVTASNAELTVGADGTYVIALSDESGKLLDTYTIDPETGIGTDSANEEVNLPQTGNNSLNNILLVLGAFMMIGLLDIPII